MPILIKSAVGDHVREVTEKQIKMCTYLRGIEEGGSMIPLPEGAITPEGSSAHVIEHTIPLSLDIIADFLKLHEDDPPVPEDYQKKAVTPLSEADMTLFKRILATKKNENGEDVPHEHPGKDLEGLVNASGFLSCMHLILGVSQFTAQQLAAMTSKEIQVFFGKVATFTEDDEANVLAKYPSLIG